MRYLLSFTALLLFASMSWLTGCGSDSSTDPGASASQSRAEQVEQADAPPSQAELQQRALDRLEAYYRALEKEDVDVTRYFAPQVDRFFGSRDLSRDQVAQSLQRSFEQIKNRRLQIDPQSVEVLPLRDGYEVRFEGQSEVLRNPEGERVRSNFRNQVRFDESWQIISYRDITTQAQSRSLAPANAKQGGYGLEAVVQRTLQAFRSGELGQASSAIHPEHGIHLIISPGALSTVYHFDQLTQLPQRAPWLADGLENLDVVPRNAAVPPFSCNDLFAREGIFLQRLDQPYDGMSQLMTSLNEVEPGMFEASAISRARSAEEQIGAMVVDTDAMVGFYFGEGEGRWYLMAVDLASYDCSA